MRYFLSLLFTAFILQSSAQEQRIGDTTATGIVTHSLRAINGKGTGERPAMFDSLGKLIPGSFLGGNMLAKDGFIKTGDSVYFGSPSPGSGLHNFSTNRHQYLNGYYYSIGGSKYDPNTRPVFRTYDNGDFTSNAINNYNDPASVYKNGIRFNAKLGYLELGTGNYIDTSISSIFQGTQYSTSALILNTEDPNYLSGPIKNSIINAANVSLPADNSIAESTISGGSYFFGGTGRFYAVIAAGGWSWINAAVNSSILSGNSQRVYKDDRGSIWTGFYNVNAAKTASNIIGGSVNTMGSVNQLTVGNYLVNRSFSATSLGNSNVDFTSLPYNDLDSIVHSNAQNIQKNYLLFSLGNSNAKNAQTRSNALTVLYSGRTQINTTGFENNLTESDVTPKAALDIVSNNSGILIPRLSNTQKNSIASTDLHNGLLLYNTDSSSFQFYNGSLWKTIGSGASDASSGWGLAGNSAGTSNFIGTTNTQPLIFKSNNTEGIRIVSTGQVGIGVTNATTAFFGENNYKLFVEGSMKARKVKVDAETWADYVFAKNYQLPTLSQVEAYIKKHQHLPDVPSASEVKEKGLDLGENQVLLLKKIEELTLYAIEQNKRIEEQAKLNQTLEERLKALESKVK